MRSGAGLIDPPSPAPRVVVAALQAERTRSRRGTEPFGDAVSASMQCTVRANTPAVLFQSIVTNRLWSATGKYGVRPDEITGALNGAVSVWDPVGSGPEAR